MSEIIVRPEPRSFLNSAIQRALDLGLVSNDWLQRYSHEAERRAERLAERNTRHRSPSDAEYRGAFVRIRQLLTFAVERRSLGDLDAAARCVANAPMPELIRDGLRSMRQLRSTMQHVVRQLQQYGGYASKEPEQYVLDGERFLSETLEDLGRDDVSPDVIDKIAEGIWFGRFEIELGLLLVQRFRRYHLTYIGTRFPQLIGNLAVNLGLNGKLEIAVTLNEIGVFLRRLFPQATVDREYADQLGRRMTEAIVKIGGSPELCRWFQQHGWPKYVETIRDFAEHGEVNAVRCSDWTVFNPTDRKGRAKTVLTGFRLHGLVIGKMRHRTDRANLDFLGQLDDNSCELCLEELAKTDPAQAARLLDGIETKRAMTILRTHRVRLVDFDKDDPTLPPWLALYLQGLRRRPRRMADRKSIFRKTRLRGDTIVPRRD